MAVAAQTERLYGAATSDLPERSSAQVETFTLLRRWQDYLAVSGRVNANTARQYRRALLGFLADTLSPLHSVCEDDVVAWMATKDGHGSQRQLTLRGLKSFYGWAAARELIGADPTTHLHLRRQKYGRAPSLSPEQLGAVLQAADRVDPRARWTIQLAYATAARVGSLAAVIPTDVDLRADWIDFREAKWDEPYGVPLGTKGREAAEHLLALVDYRPPKVASRRSTLIGVGPERIRQWVERAGELAGVEVWPHLLRHTAITRLAEAGVDVRTIIEYANWRDPSQLRRYAAPSDPNLRAAAEVL